MKLMYRLMLSFFAIIVTLMIIVSISFINVTNNTLYHNTWQQLKSYSDSLIQDSIRYNMATQSFEGFATESLNSNANLLTRQNVHFAIYDTTHRKIFASNGFAPNMSRNDWQKLKKGETVYTKLITPKINTRVSNSTSPRMTEVSRPYFYKGKMIAVVSIATFVSTIEQNMRQIKLNLIMALLAASLITLAVSYFLARSITKRIDSLRMATHQIARGNYNVEVNDSGRDEVADLGRSFNQMTTSLRESQQEIRRQEERRRQFMADAAHEMRTPLTTINGILEGLQYDAIPEEDKKHSIQLMQNDTRRLIRLVNDNLDYEKIRTNQIAMERKVFDASAVLENLREQLAKKAKEKHDILKLDVARNLRVYADYDRFVQIMFNIIQNAIQFTDNGLISIRGKRVEKGSQFQIEDNGIGMTPEQLDNIWERYYKADRSRMNTKYGESGLGLAIVHQLVLLHGGKIDVKSTYGKGTTFTIFFPDRDYAPHNSQQTNNNDKK
ncbi:HAMP domain-containing histidine kinase [Limosilactobacillus sp. STM2_1]|uniref:histidine kinase n=1 Tax=Limosilactobacillus rudii TaxID=2759755 RepID=A0A7W3UMJ9_9LACO|nr:HAMP domain-containing sensor histidine kinase [Limosilactobacillus rudii]MBB1080307.1 HAMP domain-containing histidine kinase [Limosilactobacillus rudii]MBB1098333.1 HAMP domain-containing histidine kinase [Limosilactobacillus rudii]MCD7135341.1 HAMP domain-containing histidine kinase [Limosilactobacillus rudii]